jgi:hypothetical protein
LTSKQININHLHRCDGSKNDPQSLGGEIMSTRGSSAGSSGFTRRRLLKTGGSAFALTAAVGIAPKFLRPAFADTALAPGMIGGPTGFEGAERYQYGPDTPEGRAVEAARP